jgi:hypothetical protein
MVRHISIPEYEIREAREKLQDFESVLQMIVRSKNLTGDGVLYERWVKSRARAILAKWGHQNKGWIDLAGNWHDEVDPDA